MLSLIAAVIPWDWLFGIGAVFTAFLFAFVAGGKSQRQKTKIDAQSGYISTRKKIDETDIPDDAGVLREWLRARDPDKP